jgi:hypothetical protein
MARRGTLDENAEDTLVRVFQAAQGLQSRILRINTRGFLNGYALDELKAQTRGLLADLDCIEPTQLNDPR